LDCRAAHGRVPDHAQPLYLWVSRRRSPIERRLKQLEEDLQAAGIDLAS